MAQNTKGDKPSSSNRETRFKTPRKSNQKKKPSRRIKQSGDKPSNRASMPGTRTRTGERAGRPLRPMYGKGKPGAEKQRAWTGDISGRRLRARPSNSSSRNVYPQPPRTNSSSRQPKSRASINQRSRTVRPTPRQPDGGQMRVQGRRVIPPSASGRVRNVYSQKSVYVNNQTRKPPTYQSRINKSALGHMHRRPGAEKRVVQRRVVPKSASSPFIARKSTNVWAHFPRPKKRGEKAVTKDLAGNKLRKKNFETPRPVGGNPTMNYRPRRAIGERPYKGPAGGYAIAPRAGQKAWRGDVARRRIRGGKVRGGSDRGFLGVFKGGRSATESGEARPGGNPIPVRPPGMATSRAGRYQGNIRVSQRRGFGDQGEGYSGNIKSRRAMKGGGSVSGRGWNNKGLPILGRAPGRGANRIGTYQGNVRAGRKGFTNQGEEYTGNIRSNRRRGFSNQGEEYTGNIRLDRRRAFMDQGEEYTGNIKARRPLHGGGSASGKLWNNNRKPIEGKVPTGRAMRIASFKGNVRAGRKGFSNQGEEYTGNIKARRPEKGGGSVSGKLWNNDERPIVKHDYSSESRRLSKYSGHIKAKRPQKGGGSVSGKLWNNDEEPIAVRVPKNNQGGEFRGNIKLSKRYSKNPNSADDALMGVKPTASSVKAGGYARGVKRDWDYIKNPSSAREAQRVREPGKAFARSTDYQGNIKMKKFELFNKKRELHPDAKFVKLNKNNVPEEKDMLTNFKLWWARLFKKSETQPDHLKEKERKPRYDKGESGLWYE